MNEDDSGVSGALSGAVIVATFLVVSVGIVLHESGILTAGMSWKDTVFVFPMGALCLVACWSASQIQRQIREMREWGAGKQEERILGLLGVVRGRHPSRLIPNAFMTLGMLFTFLGIYGAMVGYDTSNGSFAKVSVDAVMSGSAKAFLSSITGTILNLLSRFVFEHLWDSYESTAERVARDMYVAAGDEEIELKESIILMYPGLATLAPVREHMRQSELLDRLVNTVEKVETSNVSPSAPPWDEITERLQELVTSFDEYQGRQQDLLESLINRDDDASESGVQTLLETLAGQLEQIIRLLPLSGNMDVVLQRQVSLAERLERLSNRLDGFYETEGNTVLQAIERTMKNFQGESAQRESFNTEVKAFTLAVQRLHGAINTLVDELKPSRGGDR
jgi:hypothetical protein